MIKEIIAEIALELSVNDCQVENVLKLLEEGNTVPFIARYRKEATGALDEEVIRGQYGNVESNGEMLNPILDKEKIRENASRSDEYNGNLPETLEELVKLPGIGRKTANLICGDVYGLPAVVADTHCIRISARLGLTATKDPKAVEMALRKILPPDESNDFCHRIVLHGRDTCIARNPKCDECVCREFCPKILKKL